MKGFAKPPSVLKAFELAEAKKKDDYPIGTLRLYMGKMANKAKAAHIYVKTGKKGKPWSYYATYPSDKADDILNAGAGIVVDIDGKQKILPATPENLSDHGKEHPFKGELIPSLVDGEYNLGAVSDDGYVSIDPSGLKELETTVDKLKKDGEEPAPATEPVSKEVFPEPTVPPEPPEPVPPSTPAKPADEPKKKKYSGFDNDDIKTALADYNAGWLSASGAAAEYPGLSDFFQKFTDIEDAEPVVGWDDAFWIAANFLKDPDSAKTNYLTPGMGGGAHPFKNAAAAIAKAMGIKVLPPPISKTASLLGPEIQKALLHYTNDGGITLDQLADENPGLADNLAQYVADTSAGQTWKDAAFVAIAFSEDPEKATKKYFHSATPGVFASIAAKMAPAFGIDVPKKTPEPASLADVAKIVGSWHQDGLDSKDIEAGISKLLAAHPKFFEGYGHAPVLVGSLAGLLYKNGAESVLKDFSHIQQHIPPALIKKIAKDIGVSVPEDPVEVPTPAPSVPATPTTSPTPEDAKLKSMISFLKQIGFGDAQKQKDFLKSPAWMSQMNSEHGKDWLSKLMAGAKALGINPASLEPEEAPQKKKPEQGATLDPETEQKLQGIGQTLKINNGWASTLAADQKQWLADYVDKHFPGKTYYDAAAVIGMIASKGIDATVKQFSKVEPFAAMLKKIAPDMGYIVFDDEEDEPKKKKKKEPGIALGSELSTAAKLTNIGKEYQAVGNSFAKLTKKSKIQLAQWAADNNVPGGDTQLAMALGDLTSDKPKIQQSDVPWVQQLAKELGVSLGGLQPVGGGLAAASLIPQAPSTGTAAKEAPASTLPQPSLQYTTITQPQTPSLAQMTKTKAAKALGGAGKKDFYKGPDGKKQYLVKLALEKDGSGKAKPFAAIVQEVFSAVALTVRPDHIPITAEADPETGKLITIQPFVDRASPPTLDGMSPASLTPQEKADVATEHVLDWMMSQHDSHPENLIRRKDGRIVGVDKEQAFRFFPDDKLSVDYNPNPVAPFYNQFWSAFQNNQMDFDPTVMKGAIEKIEKISDDEYLGQLNRYATSIWPTESTKQKKFLQAGLERKKNIRADFEGFITDLYRKRTNKTKGTFTFGVGWDPTGSAPTTAPKKNIVKVKAKEWAVHLGLKEYPYAPTEGTDKGQTDPNKIVIKISKHDASKEKLDQFIKDTGLKPAGAVITGNYYHIAVFDKNAYDAVEMEKELPKPIEVDPEDSSAIVEVDPHKPAEMNNQEIADIETAQLGPLGKRFASDSAGIEGQYMRAKRMVDDTGEVSYLFQFKMRPALADTLVGGSSGNHSFPKLSYQPGPDALAEAGGNVSSMTLKGLKWKNSGSEAFIYKDDSQYTFKNSVFVKVKPKKGQSVMEAFDAVLEKMRPGLAKDLLRNPTADEREVAKLARLLWAAAPQEADNLKNSDYTLENLKKKLSKLGFSDDDYAKIEERETYSGLQSHIIPGRHKKLGGGKFRFMFNGVSDVGAAVSILKLGLLGISERAMMGIPLKGASVEADIKEGAGDQVLLRPVTENGFTHALTSHPFGGQYQAIVDPAEADRLDSFMHNSDQFGACSPYGSHSSAWTGRKTLEKSMEAQAKSYHAGAEIMFRKGIARSKILRMACASQASRATLIKEAKAAGIVEVNGVSIDNFVVVANTCSEAYEKCVKPVLAKAAAKASK